MKQSVDQQNVPRWTKKNFISAWSTNICINIEIFCIMSAVNIKCFTHNTVLVTFSNQHNYSGVLRMKVTVTHNKIQKEKKKNVMRFHPNVGESRSESKQPCLQPECPKMPFEHNFNALYFYFQCAFYWLLKGAPSVCQSSEPEQMGCSPRPTNTAVSHKIMWFYSWKNQPFRIHSLCIRLNTVPVWPLIKNRNWPFNI